MAWLVLPHTEGHSGPVQRHLHQPWNTRVECVPGMTEYTVNIQVKIDNLQDYAELLSWVMSRGEFISSRIAVRPSWLDEV